MTATIVAIAKNGGPGAVRQTDNHRLADILPHGGRADFPQHAGGVDGRRIGDVDAKQGLAAAAECADQYRFPAATDIGVGYRQFAIHKITVAVFRVCQRGQGGIYHGFRHIGEDFDTGAGV